MNSCSSQPVDISGDVTVPDDAEMSSARLVVLAGGVVGEEYLIPNDRLLCIGRDSNSDIHLDVASVSRCHAGVEIRNENKVWLRDLGSRNGIEVDGQSINEALRLEDGAIIRLGQAKLKFLDRVDPELTREEKLFIQATRDPLTGLYNRRFMQEVLVRMLAEHGRREASLAMVLMDLDNFKQINEEYGREMGDEILHQVAAQIRSKFRTTDLTARYGGDEFVVLLPDTDAKTARQVLQNIQEALLDAGSTAAPHITLSAGASGIVPPRNADFEDLASTIIKRAEEAIYMAKQRGLNKIVGFGLKQIVGDVDIKGLPPT